MEHCTFKKQLRSKKCALQNNWLKKAEEANKFWLEVPLESIMGKKHHVQKLVIKKGANGKKYDKKVQESMFSIMKQEKIQARLEIIRGVISIERVRKAIDLTAKKRSHKHDTSSSIAKDNKRKPQTVEEISDLKLSKKQKGKEKQIIQLEMNSVDPQPEQRIHKVKRRVNKKNQDPLREGSEMGKRKKDKKEETKAEIAKKHVKTLKAI
ncbi:13378_t:CDS:2 [Gigaspora margarita]|uniref:13378_t:CDS:1 n=1 Tax=Gigaspora margarita TaxID=4874 RepID=A0ABM8VXQ8_GIGMA|nr:13378_t:CDS:2 [Gigaspora margarita]